MNIFHILKVLGPFLYKQEKRYKIRLLIAIVFVFLTMGCNLIIPLLLKKSVCLLETTFNAAFFVILSYGIIWTLAQILGNIRELVLVRLIEKIVKDLSLKVFNHLHVLSLRFHLNRQTGAIIHGIEKAQGAIPDVFWGIFLYIIPTFLEIIAAASILVQLYHYTYGLLLLSVFGLFFALNFLSMRYIYTAQRQRNKARSKSNAFIVDSLLNFETVKCFNTYHIESDRCSRLLDERETAIVHFERLMNILSIIQGGIIGVGLIIMTFIVGKDIAKGILKTEDFILINGYFIQFAGPLSFFGHVLKSVRKGMTEIENVVHILDQHSDIQDQPNAGTLSVPQHQATITFENVHFAYDKPRPILQGISFHLPAGKTLAIVGATGAGKSTISRLLFRFYDVNQGRILINDQDISQIQQSSVRDALGIVPQDTVLFNDTLYNNIAYADEKCSLEDVERVVRICRLEPLIATLPEGYQTVVGERGLKLSGGEKQRIAIARVLLKKPIIYVFDEATSALDTKTERDIQQQLKDISKGNTTLIVAHRLSTIVHADSIIVLDKGKIIEQGNHVELLQKQGIYAQLWNRQQTGIGQ